MCSTGDNTASFFLLVSASAPVVVATLLNLGVKPAQRRRECPIETALRAFDAVQLGLAGFSMPGHDAPTVPVVWFILWTPNHAAAFAEKGVDERHQIFPQQVTQRPDLCAGLHLSFVNPQMRPDGGAMWFFSWSSPSRATP
jgi:hypothetical protein